MTGDPHVAASPDAEPPQSEFGASDVAVVIVAYNSAGYLGAALESLEAEGPAQVVVVDNASPDESASVARERGADVVVLEENAGYGAGFNAGFAATSAPVVLALNPDCVVEAGALDALAAAFAHSETLGAAGPMLVNSDGSVQRSCRQFPTVFGAALHGFLGLFWAGNPFTRRYQMADWDHGSPRLVDWVSGAALAARRSALDAVDGFDPGYFMYVEDVDLCWRLWRAGWSVAFEPAARITHAVGTSSGRQPYRLIVEHHKSMLRFERRRRNKRGLTWPLVWAGVWTRAGLALAARAFGRKPAADPRSGVM